jgi:hypothetical protein
VGGSSGDGDILAELTDMTKTRMIIRDSGTLVSGDLATRVVGGFDYVRLHLFWEVFHRYFRDHPLTEEIAGSIATKLLLSRLNDPPVSIDYRDYFRLSLYVHILAELGEPEAIPALSRIGENAHLKDLWIEQLKEEAGAAIAKIKARN